MRYLYNSHLGGLYTAHKMLEYEDLHCEACGDSDWIIGAFQTINDFWQLIKDECDVDGSGGWSLQYVYPLIVKEFNLSDAVQYDGDNERYCGICRHSDREILDRIQELIKENNNEMS